MELGLYTIITNPWSANTAFLSLVILVGYKKIRRFRENNSNITGQNCQNGRANRAMLNIRSSFFNAWTGYSKFIRKYTSSEEGLRNKRVKCDTAAVNRINEDLEKIVIDQEELINFHYERLNKLQVANDKLKLIASKLSTNTFSIIKEEHNQENSSAEMQEEDLSIKTTKELLRIIERYQDQHNTLQYYTEGQAKIFNEDLVRIEDFIEKHRSLLPLRRIG